MGIAVNCPNCGAMFQARDEHAGKRTQCLKCQHLFQIPGAAPAARATAVAKTSAPGPAKAARAATPGDDLGLVSGEAATAAKPQPAEKPNPAALAQEILTGFRSAIEPVETPLSYRLGIALVALVMVLLPLVYLAIIAIVGYLLYWHATHDWVWISLAPGGRPKGLALILYLSVLAAGGILILFMIKPLFARPAKVPARRSLYREKEPLLFAFVDRVCAAVGSPTPRRIDVDCQVNASAGFRRGWLSMFTGGDLVLTIGLPLVAGLDLRQFAGVLAHEFGHFTQGAGMRLTYVVRSISWWFTRVVYERDEWDQKLVEWTNSGDSRLAIVLYLTQFFVWATRKVLWVLMMLGHAVAGFMLRQMEFDADRHEARLAGSDVFQSTSRRLVTLNVANDGAMSALGSFYKEGRLGDNLPKLIVANISQIPAEVHKKIDEHVAQAKTGLLDTHPADKDRMASARRENAPGVFHVNRPASALFVDFTGLSINVTLDFYKAIFGPRFKAEEVHAVETLLARQEVEQEADKAVKRYFQGQFSILRPLPMAEWKLEPPAEPKKTVAQMKQARQAMLNAVPGYKENYAAYDKSDTITIEADQAEAIFRAECKLPKGDFSVRLTNRDDASRAKLSAEACLRQMATQLTEFEQAASRRLSSALDLLCVSQVAARIETAAAWRKEIARITPALAIVVRSARDLIELRNSHLTLAALCSQLENHSDKESLLATIHVQMHRVHRQMSELYGRLSNAEYPFDHAKGTLTLATYTLDSLPHQDDLRGVYEASGEVISTVIRLYSRLVGRLVVMAEKIESLFGLPALPEPPEEKKPEDQSTANN